MKIAYPAPSLRLNRAFRRIAGRLIEFELLVTAGLLLASIIAALVIATGQTFPESVVLIGLTQAFLLLCFSMVLGLRDWNEDQILLPTATLLAGIGLVMIWRLAPGLRDFYGDIAHRHAVWTFVALTVLALVTFLPWRMHWLKHYRYSWLLLGLLLVGATMVFGIEQNGARLWLNLGLMQFQPVELLKILLVVYLATYLDDRRSLINTSYYLWGLRLPPLPYLVPMAIMWGLTVGMIIIQKDLGAALLFFSIFLAMLYVLTCQAWYVIAGLVAFVFGAAFLYPLFEYVQIRVDAWYDPWSDPLNRGYQMMEALYALAVGGYVGTGPGLGDPTTVPSSHTDFVFVAIGEELGMIGTLGVLACYMLIAVRGFQIALRTRDGFQQLLATGLTTAITIQALIITAGTINLIPLTGITLPFVSYSGSSLVVHFVMIGLLMRISATNKDPRVGS
ncbi:MAG: FtsW/RodA/SpoVE family cell cycle protein [Chloroflexaceae bacterium]|nr:FtsW/RodA/SpoVE family cell cycle protein [Chloroflexaceae bacterium]